MWWRLPNATKNGLGGRKVETLPLYGVDDVAGEMVVVVEGEEARKALAARGIVAVGTVTGAATIPSGDVLRELVGYDGVGWAESAAPGRQHMGRLATRLRALGGTVRWFDPWPDVTEGQDAANFTGSTEELRALIQRAAPDGDRGAPRAAPTSVGVLLADVTPE